MGSTSESTLNNQDKSCYIVAEVSANHNQKLEKAKDIIRAAADAGADAIKLQTYTADTITLNCDNEYFQISGTLWNGRTLHNLYDEAHTPWEWHKPLQELAEYLNLDFFSTPFDTTAVDFLESLDVQLYKVASFEIVDIALLQKIASTGKPVIMSTGMASLAEIDEAMTTLREGGAGPVTLLKCTSVYPAPPEEANLRTIPALAKIFNCKVGLSDHTMCSDIAVAAVVLGATVIEKHFTLSRNDGGPDGAFSMEPDEFKQMVQSIRTVEKALGEVNFTLTEHEKISRLFRRSLFVVNDVEAGDTFTKSNVRSIRPGYGLAPKFLPDVLGRKASCDLKSGTPLGWGLVR